MAFTILKGSGAKVFVTDSGATSREMTSYWLSGGPSLNIDLVDVTALADSAQAMSVGLARHNWTMEFLWDDTATTGSWAVLNGRLGEDTARNVIFHPAGNASGKPRITIPVKMASLSFAGGVGEALKISVEWQQSGAATIDTNP